MLNNRPLCFMYDDDVSEALTSNSWRKFELENKCIDEGDFEVAEENELWWRKCAVQKIVENFRLMWHR